MCLWLVAYQSTYIHAHVHGAGGPLTALVRSIAKSSSTCVRTYVRKYVHQLTVMKGYTKMHYLGAFNFTSFFPTPTITSPWTLPLCPLCHSLSFPLMQWFSWCKIMGIVTAVGKTRLFPSDCCHSNAYNVSALAMVQIESGVLSPTSCCRDNCTGQYHSGQEAGDGTPD